MRCCCDNSNQVYMDCCRVDRWWLSVAVCCVWQSVEAVRKRKLQLMRFSETVRRDDALRTTRQRLRQTDHWSMIGDRQRRAFEQLCDEVRRQRRCDSHKSSSSSSSTEPSQRRCGDKIRTDEVLAAVKPSSSDFLAATTTTKTSICCVGINERMTNGESVQHVASTTSTEVTAPSVCVTLGVTTTSGTRQSVVTSVALCVTTVGCLCTSTTSTTEHLCAVMASTSASAVAARQSYVTASSTAARCVSRAPSKLPSPAVRGRVTFHERPTEIPTTNGDVVSRDNNDNNDSHKDDDDDDKTVPQDSSSVALTSTLTTNPMTLADVDKPRNLQCTSSNGFSGVPQLLSNRKDNSQKVSNFTSSAPDFGGVKENVPPGTALVNGINDNVTSTNATPERVDRPASASHQQQRGGCSGKGVVGTSSTGNNTARVGKMPPPVPTRTSSVLTGGVVAARSVAARPMSWQAKVNGHLPGKEPSRATPAPAPRSSSVPPESTIKNSLSYPGAFKRDRASPATATGEVDIDVTETDIYWLTRYKPTVDIRRPKVSEFFLSRRSTTLESGKWKYFPVQSEGLHNLCPRDAKTGTTRWNHLLRQCV